MMASAAPPPAGGVDQCQAALEGVGAGIGASLRAIDCAANAMSQAAFSRIFGPEGAFLLPLQIILSIFVALLGYGLITGRLRIGLSALAPRIITLGVVLTLATSWIAFQNVFWGLLVGGPDQIAGVMMGTQGSASTIFADKLDVVMYSLMEASGGAGASETTSIFSPPGLLWAGGTMLLLGTVGVLATCKIALAVLLGLGPIFIVMALFKGTRGLFAGWLKAAVLMALAPLFAVLGGTLMLELATPVLSSLMTTPGQIDVRPAMAFFMIGAVHLALMAMVMKVTSTMVAGWSVFGLAGGSDRNDEQRDRVPATDRVSQVATSPGVAAAGAAGMSAAPARDIRVAANMPIAANDSGEIRATTRETRIIAGAAGSAASGQADSTSPSRARGIGSRFKSAPARPASSARPERKPS
ncbi:type IV secretion system protein [Altererythrobacter sp. KTW20L]|uniref:type IV secretion system protein n=1 Tax=Altererythrobacter sp. KTW20L TaxID=2942210 RepID=UPI0020BD6382|nr:type IV secretion system protein [Altererythrobacter sp. KTW20L]MCL6250366.1 type IV secretion system protein [Altererythrobacter sp. KTW20L]